MKLGIDVCTKHADILIGLLSVHPQTLAVESGGMYREDNMFSQVWIDTKMTVEELDDWLYYHSNVDYIGVFGRENES